MTDGRRSSNVERERRVHSGPPTVGLSVRLDPEAAAGVGRVASDLGCTMAEAVAALVESALERWDGEV